jgi:putative addiction module component (TIGR02574 family)
MVLKILLEKLEEQMDNNTQQICKDALAMPPVEKAALIEKLFHSFDQERQGAIDQLWAEEAESRLDGFESGKISAKPFSAVLVELNTK